MYVKIIYVAYISESQKQLLKKIAATQHVQYFATSRPDRGTRYEREWADQSLTSELFRGPQCGHDKPSGISFSLSVRGVEVNSKCGSCWKTDEGEGR